MPSWKACSVITWTDTWLKLRRPCTFRNNSGTFLDNPGFKYVCVCLRCMHLKVERIYRRLKNLISMLRTFAPEKSWKTPRKTLHFISHNNLSLFPCCLIYHIPSLFPCCLIYHIPSLFPCIYMLVSYIIYIMYIYIYKYHGSFHPCLAQFILVQFLRVKPFQWGLTV